jgi:signal transduction histidine kinase
LFNQGGEASHLLLDQGGIVDLAVSRVPDHSLYLVLGRDVTHEREMESKVREDQKLKAIGHLAGGIAHDFNNLLGGIGGYAELLQLDSDPAVREEAVEGILETTSRAADLVAGLLAFARRGAYEAKVVDLHALIEQVVKIASRTFDRRIHIGVQLDANPSTVRGDAAQLQAAILNLALNARDAMPEGGHMKIRTRTVTVATLSGAVDANLLIGEELEQGEGVDEVVDELTGRIVGTARGESAAEDTSDLPPWIELSIEDQGGGIAEEHRDHVFEPFFTTKAGGKGTGLGLSVVYGTVRAHGGTIDLETEIGFGSTFRIRLQTVAEVADAATPAAPHVGRGIGKRILVVDDEPTVRSTMTRFLQYLGYEVVAVPGGIEALEYFGADGGGFDLVVLDLVMPDLHGSEVMKRMRSRAAHIPIIVVTGYSMLSSSATLDLGADALLRKPFPIGSLARHIGEILLDRAAGEGA